MRRKTERGYVHFPPESETIPVVFSPGDHLLNRHQVAILEAMMAEDPQKPEMDEEPEVDPDSLTADDLDGEDGIKESMTEEEIRAAGLAIDVPFEAGSPDPQPLEYGDIGDEFAMEELPEGWEPQHVDIDPDPAAIQNAQQDAQEGTEGSSSGSEGQDTDEAKKPAPKPPESK